MELFMGGRLCLLGEHSDWASNYQEINNRIIDGCALAIGLSQGITAIVNKDEKKFVIEMPNDFEKSLSISFTEENLLKEIDNNTFFAYACGAALTIKKKYDVGGITIRISKITLPIKKGLASSAAICLLIVRTFNRLYGLNLSEDDEMRLACDGEKITGSQCGLMDEVSVLGNKLFVLNFKKDKLTHELCKVKKPIYIVFADLNSKKNTKKILEDLNRAYPFAHCSKEKRVHYFLGKKNREIIDKALKYLQIGNIKGFGRLYNYTQKLFDRYMTPLCPSELIAPNLHKYLNDKYIKTLTYGGKGVGSQGDGSVQFVAKDKKSQESLKKYLIDKGLNAYSITIEPQGNKIETAIIPVAGYGTRLYPYTKIINKEFYPVLHNGLLKPQISILLEELYDCGIREFYLTISSKKQYLFYKNYFKHSTKYLQKTNNQINSNFDNKLKSIWKCMHFIYNKDVEKGFAYSISLFSKIVKSDVLLCLGDTLYQSNNTPCIKQLFDEYANFNHSMVGVAEIELKECINYGVCQLNNNKNKLVQVNKFYEKPSIEYAKNNLLTNNKLYGLFGCYIISPENFPIIKKRFACDKNVDFTKCLDLFREENGFYAVLIKGKSLDFGNIRSISKNLLKFDGSTNNE